LRFGILFAILVLGFRFWAFGFGFSVFVKDQRSKIEDPEPKPKTQNPKPKLLCLRILNEFFKRCNGNRAIFVFFIFERRARGRLIGVLKYR
jgi:hypothetical protein